MKAQRVISILMFAAVLTNGSAGVRAQGSVAADLKQRIFQQLTAGAKTRTGSLVDEQLRGAPDISDRPSLPDGDKDNSAADKKKSLLGTWNLTLTFNDGSQVRSTLNVIPGRSDTEGSIIHAAEVSLSPPNPTLPEQGVWEYVKGQQFIASYRGWSFTDTFLPFGTVGFRQRITVEADSETFTGEGIIEVKDSTGQVLFSDSLHTRGVRQHAVAP